MQAIADLQILGPLPPYFLGLEDAEMRLRSESVLYIHVNMHLLDSFPCLSLQFNKNSSHDIVTAYKLSCYSWLFGYFIGFFLSSFICFMIVLEENSITPTRMGILSQTLSGIHPFSRHNISYFQSSLGLKKIAWQWFTKNCNLILWNNRLFICAPCNDPRSATQSVP